MPAGNRRLKWPGGPRDTGARQQGVSLIEVLVSIVVVSVGVLSAISLQLTSKRNNFDVAQRLEATHLANGLLERLRTNSSRGALQVYVENSEPFLGGGQQGEIPSPDCSAAGDSCTPAQLALFDLWLWEQLLDGVTEQVQTGAAIYYAGGLVFPTACIDPPTSGAGSAGAYTLTIAFRGTTRLPADPAVACGGGAVQDGIALYGENDEYRRSIVVQAFITPAVDK